MSNGIGRVWAVNAEGGDEGRPNGVGPVWIENADQLGSKLPEPESSDAGKVLGVLNSDGDIGWVPDQEGMAQVQADWDQTDSSQVSYIANKPNLATVATTGDYDDLTDKPDLSIYAESSNLATVATTGSYDDLVDKPTIPQAQVNSDWNASSGVAEILNKPTLSTVATTGDYNDLSNKPSIPAAQINSDWNAASGVAEILNKPSLAAVATSGDYSDLLNTPTIPAAQVNSDWNSNSGVSQILNKPSLATVATSGSYNDLSNTPTIPSGAQLVPAATSSDADKVLTVNAQGAPEWAEAQGGYTAGNGIAIANDEISASIGTGLEFDTTPHPVTTTAHSIAYNWMSGSVTVMQTLDASLASKIATDGIVYTIQNLIDDNNVSQAWSYTGVYGLKLYPAIGHINRVYFGPSIDRANVLVLSNTGVEVMGTSGSLTAGTQLSYNLNDVNTTLSTITWESVVADPENYSLCVVWESTANDSYLEATGTFTANAQYDSGTITVMEPGSGDIKVSNPLPASTSADEDKVLTVNSSGTPVWATAQSGSSYTAGDGISITSDVISVATDDTISKVYPLGSTVTYLLTNDGGQGKAYFDSNEAGLPLGDVLNVYPEEGTLRVLCSAGRFYLQGALGSSLDIKAYVVISSDPYFNNFAVYPTEIPATYVQADDAWIVDAVDVTVPTIVSTINGWISKNNPDYGHMRYIGIGFGDSANNVSTGTIAYGDNNIYPSSNDVAFWYPNITANKVLSVAQAIADAIGPIETALANL